MTKRFIYLVNVTALKSAVAARLAVMFFSFLFFFLKNAVQLKNCAGSEDEDPNTNYAHYGKKRPAVCDKCINTPLQL